MKKLILILAAVAAAGGLAACSDKPGPRLREIERFSEMTDEEIDAAKEACYKISTTDYNCARVGAARPRHVHRRMESPRGADENLPQESIPEF